MICVQGAGHRQHTALLGGAAGRRHRRSRRQHGSVSGDVGGSICSESGVGVSIGGGVPTMNIGTHF